MKGFSDWETITPDKHYDWVDQRSETFTQFYPTRFSGREGRQWLTIMHIWVIFYSNGCQNWNRDAYIYNFYTRCLRRDMQLLMTQDYLNASF